MKFRADRGGLPRSAIDDIEQAAALVLWCQCLRAVDPAEVPFEIDCGIMALAGYKAWKRDDRRHCMASLDADWEDAAAGGWKSAIPAHSETIRVDGVDLNAVDARLDHPVMCDRLEGRLLTTREAAAMLGLTRARVHQLTKRLGVRNGCWKWAFPLNAVQKYGERIKLRRQRLLAMNAQVRPDSKQRQRLATNAQTRPASGERNRLAVQRR